jgi:hypothetical protein
MCLDGLEAVNTRTLHEKLSVRDIQNALILSASGATRLDGLTRSILGGNYRLTLVRHAVTRQSLIPYLFTFLILTHLRSFHNSAQFPPMLASVGALSTPPKDESCAS